VGPRAGLDTEARGKLLLPLTGIEPVPDDRIVKMILDDSGDLGGKILKLAWQLETCSVYTGYGLLSNWYL
jgi:hypothetical protein